MKRAATSLSLIAVLVLAATTESFFSRAQNPAFDDVDVRTEEGMAQVRIRMTFPVRYLRHFPANYGEQLEIAFQIAALNPQEISLSEEMRKVAATPVLPGFSITYIPPASDNVARDPATLLIRFDRALSYQVSGGDDKDSINLYVPITPADPGKK